MASFFMPISGDFAKLVNHDVNSGCDVSGQFYPIMDQSMFFGEFGDLTHKMPGNLDFSVVSHILVCI